MVESLSVLSRVMDFQSAMETFAEAWVAANVTQVNIIPSLTIALMIRKLLNCSSVFTETKKNCEYFLKKILCNNLCNCKKKIISQGHAARVKRQKLFANEYVKQECLKKFYLKCPFYT